MEVYKSWTEKELLLSYILLFLMCFILTEYSRVKMSTRLNHVQNLDKLDFYLLPLPCDR